HESESRNNSKFAVTISRRSLHVLSLSRHSFGLANIPQCSLLCFSLSNDTVVVYRCRRKVRPAVFPNQGFLPARATSSRSLSKMALSIVREVRCTGGNRSGSCAVRKHTPRLLFGFVISNIIQPDVLRLYTAI